jgi:hypothetical protein
MGHFVQSFFLATIPRKEFASPRKLDAWWAIAAKTATFMSRLFTLRRLRAGPAPVGTASVAQQGNRGLQRRQRPRESSETGI